MIFFIPFENLFGFIILMSLFKHLVFFFVCGSECWKVTKGDTRKVDVFHSAAATVRSALSTAMVQQDD